MIYVLKLQNDHYFLLKSDETKSDSRILLEAEILYDFPKKFLPESVYKTHIDESTVDLDRYVKYYMVWFGVENVRGGSYLSVNLPDYQERTLLEEMNTASHPAVSDDLIEYANQPHSYDEIKERLQDVEKNYTQYLREKDKRIDINLDSMRNDLEWLDKECNNQMKLVLEGKANTFLYNFEKSIITKRYREILQLLKKIVFIVSNVLEIVVNEVFIKHPEFVLDDFFYHHHRMQSSSSLENLQKMMKIFSNYLNIIDNRKTERDFDVASWGPHAGLRMPREIYLMKRMLCRKTTDF